MKTKEIRFSKMQGAGNDFVVFDNREYGFLLNEIIALTPRLCHRRFGVGADGVLVLEPSEKADYRMIYRNADGSDAGMCGNGARCLARFAVREGFPSKLSFTVHDQTYRAEVFSESVAVEFPVNPQPGEPLSLLGRDSLEVYSGTEHVVCWAENEQELDNENELRKSGREIRYRSDLFPKGTNVNFVLSENGSSRLVMKTYERGVEDLTLACGTGALASSVAHHHKTEKNAGGKFDYDVVCSGGLLKTSFSFDADAKRYTNLKLQGPAVFAFDGTYYLDTTP